MLVDLRRRRDIELSRCFGHCGFGGGWVAGEDGFDDLAMLDQDFGAGCRGRSGGGRCAGGNGSAVYARRDLFAARQRGDQRVEPVVVRGERLVPGVVDRGRFDRGREFRRQPVASGVVDEPLGGPPGSPRLRGAAGSGTGRRLRQREQGSSSVPLQRFLVRQPTSDSSRASASRTGVDDTWKSRASPSIEIRAPGRIA